MLLGLEAFMGKYDTAINEFLRREKLRDEIEKEVRDKLEKDLSQNVSLECSRSQETQTEIRTAETPLRRFLCLKNQSFFSTTSRTKPAISEMIVPEEDKEPYIVARQTYCILIKAKKI